MTDGRRTGGGRETGGAIGEDAAAQQAWGWSQPEPMAGGSDEVSFVRLAEALRLWGEEEAEGIHEALGPLLDDARAFRRALSAEGRTPTARRAEMEFERLWRDIRVSSDQVTEAVSVAARGTDSWTTAAAVAMLAERLRSARLRLARLDGELRNRSVSGSPVTGCLKIVLLRDGVPREPFAFHLGEVLAREREERVLLLGADRAPGPADPDPSDVLGAMAGDGAAGIRRFASRTLYGLDRILLPADPEGCRQLSDAAYRSLLEAADRRYSVVLTDLDLTESGVPARSVLAPADQLVAVTRLNGRAEGFADRTAEWLSAEGYAALAQDSVAAVLAQRGTSLSERLAARLRGLHREIVMIPTDAEGDAVRMRPDTFAAYSLLATLVTQGFSRASTPPPRRACPNGHESEAHDYCDVCGAAMPHPAEAEESEAEETGPVLHSPVFPSQVFHGPVLRAGNVRFTWAEPADADGEQGAPPPSHGAPPRRTPPPSLHVEPRTDPTGIHIPAQPGPGEDRPAAEPRRLVAELAEQSAPGRVVPLHVQVVSGGEEGEPLRAFHVPDGGAVLFVTVHAPGLLAVDDLQQELLVRPGRDSDVLRFGLRTVQPGLHRVTVRAFAGGTFLGEVRCQISVEHGGVTRDGPVRSAPLPSVAFDPGEVTLQVLRDRDSGAFSFQLLSETCYAPETFRFRGGSPREATERIYTELRRAAKTPGDPGRLRQRLRSHGVQLWTSAVPEAVQRQFWEQADRITSFTVLGEHDIVPWELLYPLNEGRPDNGFLAEWLPVVRRVFGQDRVRALALSGAAFVVPPGSPDDTAQEVRALRARLGPGVADAGVLTERAALTELIERGHPGVLHFACHNAFTGAGSCVTMADGPFDPVDLASAAQVRSLRRDQPLVFFNACRSAGEIDWFGASLGWAPQFLRAGAGAFVGTLWPVRSDSALRFAEAFYEHLLPGREPLGRASLAARRAVRDLDGDPTWLAYAVYGSPGATARADGYAEG